MIHPDDRKREMWDMGVLVLAILVALIIPPAAVFGFTLRPAVLLLSIVTFIVFSFDIYFSFTTAYLTQGKLIEDRRLIATRYLKGTFTIDLIAALPFWIVIAAIGPPIGGNAHLLALFMVFKLISVNRTLKRIGGTTINPAILRLFHLVFWILLAAHLIGCGWIFFRDYAADIPNRIQYVEGFYWSITTLTTIGYGDLTPGGNIPLTIFVIIIELLGAGMYGLVIGNIANLIANIDVAKSQYREKLDKVNAFLKYRNIPTALQRKINEYYAYLWDTRRGYDETSVLEDLPDPLKVSVSLYLNKEIIEKVPLFEKASDDLIRDVIMHLEPVVFTPTDYIVKFGELGFDMFFISKGSVDVVSADEKTTYATLTSGQFFGEIALILSLPRNATIIAKEYCDLYRLDKDTFDRILTRHLDFAETIKELAESRRRENEKMAGQASEINGVAEEAEETTPNQVIGLQADHRGYEISVEWNGIDGASHYEVVRKDPKSDKWNYLSNNVTVPIFIDKLIMPNRVNIYRVRGIGTAGPGAWSEPLVVNKPRKQR